MRCRLIIDASISKPLNIPKDIDNNIIEYAKLDHGQDIEKQFFNVIEKSKKTTSPILIHHSPLGCSLLIVYLVVYRKWPVAASLLHVMRAIDPLPSQFDMPSICNVLLYEKSFLSYSPSVKLQSVILHLLGSEDLDISIAFYESGNNELLRYRERSSKLFKYLNSGKRSKVIKLLLISCDLMYARNGPLDYTPLILMIENEYNFKDKLTIKLFQRLADESSINLCDIYGNTPLHIASLNGIESAIKLLIEYNACIRQVSYNHGTLPLHNAVKSNCSPSILELLAEQDILDKQDLLGYTPLHIASTNGNKTAMNVLLSKGAQIKTNAIGQTPIHIVKNDPKLLQLLMEDARPGEVLYKPFNSFAPYRDNIKGKFYIDGEDGFNAISKEMKNAKESIYITGWWLTPDYYLIREGDEKEIMSSRLDRLLLERAKNNVNIYILIWENLDSIIPTKSSYAKKYLSQLHSNIHIEHHASSVQQFLAWTHHQKSIIIDEKIAFVGGLDLCLHRWDTKYHKLTDRCHVNVKFPGRDYYNPRILSDNDDRNHESFIEYDNIDRTIHPRMPWHDITCSVEGDAATDVALNFVQRWNFLIPKKLLPLPERKTPIEFKNNNLNLNDNDDDNNNNTNNNQLYCQVLRSIGGWSLNSIIETSIYEAYLHCISEAEEFIYIENQFFISPLDSKMKIGQAIISRIKRAFLSKSKFNVIIVLPIYPEGDIVSDPSVQRIYSYQQKTIMYIIDEIKEITRGTLYSPNDYINFYSLRNWGELNNHIVTELIYVHSKVMITDNYIICGSANINERSMMGDRDSEIAIVFKDKENSTKLRKKLWSEHLDINIDLLHDNINDDIELWKEIANNNSKIYITLFEDSIADSEPLTLKQYTQAYSEIRSSDILLASNLQSELKEKIKGHLVKFPIRFLYNELNSTIDLKQATFQQLKEIGGLFMDDLFR